MRPVFCWEALMPDRTDDLIASLGQEAIQIHTLQAYLRGDHRLTREEIDAELAASHARRYTLGASHAQVMLSGIYR